MYRDLYKDSERQRDRLSRRVGLLEGAIRIAAAELGARNQAGQALLRALGESAHEPTLCSHCVSDADLKKFRATGRQDRENRAESALSDLKREMAERRSRS